jgi:hypothetical protein
MHAPLTYLLTTHFNIILPLTPVSPKRSLSLGSQKKVLHIRFPRQHMANIWFLRCVMSADSVLVLIVCRCAWLLYHMCQPEMIILFYDYFALFLNILHLRLFCFCSFFKVAFPTLSCTLLLLLLLCIHLLPVQSIHNYTPEKHVSKVHDVAAILWLKNMVHVM